MIQDQSKIGDEEMQFELDNRAPVYVQVIQYFKQQIASGEIKMGEEIPSRRELARLLKINPNTVQRAYREMEEAGLIYTDGNLPSKVTMDKEIIQRTKNELLTNAVNEFIRSVQPIQIPLPELLELIKEKYVENDISKEGDKSD